MSDGDITPHIYLIDGSGFIFRAFFGLPPMTRADGTPVNAVYGFSNMLFKLIQDLDDTDRPSHLAVIFDTKRQTFRNDIYKDYKAHRPPAPEELVPQFPIIREAVKAFNLPSLAMDGYEADDLIATYATQARAKGWRVTIVSSDKDLMQLVDDETDMYDTMKNVRIDPAGVVEKFGVGPEKVVEVQALAGDSADNVPGVPGIGLKTAALLINEYGDLETLLARAGEIKQNKRREKLIEFADLARISRDLVQLECNVPVEVPLEDLTLVQPSGSDLLEFIDEQSFRSLRNKVLNHYDDIHEAPDPSMKEVIVTDVEYSCVTTMDALKVWIDAAYAAGVVAVDTETTSLNAMRAKLVGVSLSIEAGKACYIPLDHVGEAPAGQLDFGDSNTRPDQIDKAAALAALKPLLEAPAVMKVGQNIKYDLLILMNEGITIEPIDDTMLMSYALDSGRHGHGMDELSGLHLDHATIPIKELIGKGKSAITFDAVPLEKATPYAAEDADITGRLARLLKPRLAAEKVRTVYETLERPLAAVLSRMEQRGILVDGKALNKLSNDFALQLASLETVIHEMVGHPFNINSPKQLGEVLFEEMALEGGKKSKKTGAWSTNADVLDKLAGEGHDLPVKVLEWRSLSKLKSTYTDALQADINNKTKRVHTSYHMASTSTGRLSSNDPNLQNIPIRTENGRKIRQAFIPKEGHTLLAADYSQIELRVLAHMADIPALKQAFADGVDIHAMTASEVFGVPIEGMDPTVRRQAKAINFGIIYGISAFGLARQLGLDRKTAKDYIDAYFEKFPGIRAYMDDTIESCRESGYVETLFGRKCNISSIRDKNPMTRNFGERAAINAPIQGTAADIIRRAMIRMEPALTDAGLGDVQMLLQVHDELVFEVPDALLEKTIPLVKQVMEDAVKPAIDLSVPLVVDCGTGQNWDEAH